VVEEKKMEEQFSRFPRDLTTHLHGAREDIPPSRSLRGDCFQSVPRLSLPGMSLFIHFKNLITLSRSRVGSRNILSVIAKTD